MCRKKEDTESIVTRACVAVNTCRTKLNDRAVVRAELMKMLSDERCPYANMMLISLKASGAIECNSGMYSFRSEPVHRSVIERIIRESRDRNDNYYSIRTGAKSREEEMIRHLIGLGQGLQAGADNNL